MTSKARTSFNESCGDIDRLLEIHTDVTGTSPGRRWQKVESLHKAAFVLLTAFWEAFCEDLAAEALDHLVEHAPNPVNLPIDLQRRVAKELKAQEHDLAIWQLAGDGWRGFLASRLEGLQLERNKKLNTPKTAQIEDLFQKATGIADISASWHWQRIDASAAGKRLDDFVSLRGEIAHRGTAAGHVTKTEVKQYYSHVKQLVAKTEGHVAQAIIAACGSTPWV